VIPIFRDSLNYTFKDLSVAPLNGQHKVFGLRVGGAAPAQQKARPVHCGRPLGERVKIAGLGILQVRNRPARMGRNPPTGEPIQIKASKKVAFCGRVVRDVIRLESPSISPGGRPI